MPLRMRKCQHLQSLVVIDPVEHVCRKCMEMGDTWVHLRVCQTCGEVNCCDSSKNRHATRHFRETHHPVVASAEPGEDWVYCYEDEVIRPKAVLGNGKF